MRELFVKKRKQYKANPKPFEWEYGSYNSGEIKNGEWIYYDYYGEDEDPEKNRFEENTQRVTYKFTEDKLNYHRTLIYTPKHIKLIKNETSLTDKQLKEYICSLILKELNDETRERNNQKARERRARTKG